MEKLTQQQQDQLKAKLAEAKNFTPEDLEKTVKDEEKARKLGSRLAPGLFRKIKLTGSLLKDYCKGNYREVPWNTIAAFGVGIAYLVSPIDLIPDFIPVAGLMDDAALLSWIFYGFAQDLEDYATWKASQDAKRQSA